MNTGRAWKSTGGIIGNGNYVVQWLEKQHQEDLEFEEREKVKAAASMEKKERMKAERKEIALKVLSSKGINFKLYANAKERNCVYFLVSGKFFSQKENKDSQLAILESKVEEIRKFIPP
jgi:hypothetical protein